MSTDNAFEKIKKKEKENRLKKVWKVFCDTEECTEAGMKCGGGGGLENDRKI